MASVIEREVFTDPLQRLLGVPDTREWPAADLNGKLIAAAACSLSFVGDALDQGG